MLFVLTNAMAQYRDLYEKERIHCGQRYATLSHTVPLELWDVKK